MNIEDKNYAEQVEKWINSLPDVEDPTKLGGSIKSFKVNYPPLEGLMVAVTRESFGMAVIFYKIGEFFKIHHPENVEQSIKIEKGRHLWCYKTDKYWVYQEDLYPSAISTVSFGMDMTMPFLNEQNWKKL